MGSTSHGSRGYKAHVAERAGILIPMLLFTEG